MPVNTLLIVCLAIAGGALIGGISFKKISLGVAGVLFSGIFFGFITPEAKPPEALATFGLSLFVYALGLSSSSYFFDTLTHGGWRQLFIVPVAIGAALVVGIPIQKMLGLPMATTVGVFAGAMTSTPALAAATTALGAKGGAEATLGYAISYPLGVLIPILLLSLPMRKVTKSCGEVLKSGAVVLTKIEDPGESIGGIMERFSLNVRFGRCERHGEQFTLTGFSVVKNGDVVTMVGLPEGVRHAIECLGEECPETSLAAGLEMLRPFASNPSVCGKTLEEIGIHRKYSGIVTRIQRGDAEFIPSPSTVVIPGDRLRILAPGENLSAISEFVGDSYRAASEVNALTFGLGLAMGIALGTVEIHLPLGLGLFVVGPVAGCLIASLILGALGRTGPLSWHLPYGASVSLKQFGLMIFLACAGIKGGAVLHTAPLDLSTIFLGAAMTLVVSVVAIGMALRLTHRDWATVGGLLAGFQTQSAILGFAEERCGGDRVESSFTTIYPLAMLLKILSVQILISAMG